MKRTLIILLALLATLVLPAQNKTGETRFNKAYLELKVLETNPLAKESEQQKIVKELQNIINKYPEQAPKAALFLAEAYSFSVPAQLRDIPKSVDLYEKAAEMLADNPQLQSLAYFNIALAYCNSSFPQQNDSISFEYNLKASELNDAMASNVATFYSLGTGCEINPTLALEYYRRSIDTGQDCFLNYYAVKYFMDKLAADSLDEKAFALYRDYQIHRARTYGTNDQTKLSMLSESAELGYLPAQLLLGTLYMSGQAGNDPSVNTYNAEKWLKLAADQDYLPAIYQLGILYEQVYDNNGQLTQKSCTMAEPYFQKAAKQGFAPAQYRLGIYEQIGRMGASQVDYDDAEFWYQKAAIQGHPEAKQRLNALKNLTASQQKTTSPLTSATQTKKKKKWWQTALKILTTAAQICADVSQKQQALNPNQQSQMQSMGYSSSHGNPYSVLTYTQNASDSASDSASGSASGNNRQKNYTLRNMDWNTYEKHADALSDMYYGIISYDDNSRRSRQQIMREIRQKWDARGIGFSQSSWETWNGACKRTK